MSDPQLEPTPPVASDTDAEKPVILGDPWPALREFGGVAAVFALLWLIPYAHPAMEEYRYFGQLDASPLVRAVTFTQPPTAEQNALPGGTSGAAKLSAEEEEAALAALDPSLSTGPAAALPARSGPAGSRAGPAASGSRPAARRAEAAVGPAASAALAAPGAQGEHGAPPMKATPATAPKVGVADPPLPLALRISDATIGKPLVMLEHPARLRVFWQALAARARGTRKHVRIRHYGDSHLANDGISHVLRVLLQRRFGDGGHGYLLAASRTQWYRRKGVRWTTNEQWKVRNYLGGGLRDGAYGYAGGAAIGRAGASFRVRTTKAGSGARANRFELFWRGVAAGALQVRIDGKTEVIKLVGGGRDTYRSWDLPDGPHDIRVRVTRGRVRVYGAALERTEGITYDSLGVVGARARRWLNSDAAHMAGQLQHRPAALVVFNYGGNSRGDKITEARYVDRYVNVIGRLRLGAREACLIIGPTDHGKKKRGKIISDPNTIRLIAWQRSVAEKTGCAFLDSRGLMGGDGAMGRWVKQGLGWADYGHLTPLGQRTLGKAIYGTWMAGLRAYLAAKTAR